MIPTDLYGPSWDYERLTWEDYKERTARDYGVRESNYTWPDFQDLERDKDYMLSLNYF